jgi:hypothetical protein
MPKTAMSSAKKDLTEKALELLKSPELFSRHSQALKTLGVVGEERNSNILFIDGISRLLDYPLNVFAKGRSSAGKNHVCKGVLKLFPKDAVIELTSSSLRAWNYAGQDFRHRIIYVQEKNDESGTIHPARLLISEGKLTRIVTVYENGQRKAKKFVTKGPITCISTTTRNQVEIDDETRHISIWIDESEEQTRRIIKAHATEHPALPLFDLEVWREAHRVLEARAFQSRVLLPGWFQILGDEVYAGDLRVRRYFPAFTTACKAVALLRSFQKSHGWKEVSSQDITIDFADFWITRILFEPVFVESIHRGTDEALATRFAVERLVRRRGGRPVPALALMKGLSISRDAAYARIRQAAHQGTIFRANPNSKNNPKLYRPTPRPAFLPDAEKFFRANPEVGDYVNFMHPLTDEWVTLNR